MVEQLIHVAREAGDAVTEMGLGGTAMTAQVKRHDPTTGGQVGELVAEHRLRSIAFPAISTGVYRFPADLAARIAVGTVASEVAAGPRGIERAVFCCFSPDSATHHINAFTELGLA